MNASRRIAGCGTDCSSSYCRNQAFHPAGRAGNCVQPADISVPTAIMRKTGTRTNRLNVILLFILARIETVERARGAAQACDTVRTSNPQRSLLNAMGSRLKSGQMRIDVREQPSAGENVKHLDATPLRFLVRSARGSLRSFRSNCQRFRCDPIARFLEYVVQRLNKRKAQREANSSGDVRL